MQEIFEMTADGRETFELQLEKEHGVALTRLGANLRTYLGYEAAVDYLESPAAAVVFESLETFQCDLVLDVVIPATNHAPVGAERPGE